MQFILTTKVIIKEKYTLIISFPVTSLDNIPDGLIGREIYVGKSEKIISKGKMPEAILKTWVEIWQNTLLKRAYRADVTVHGKKYFDGECGSRYLYFNSGLE